MSDSVLGFVRFWNHPFSDVLDVFAITRNVRFGTAVSDMNVSAHRRANKIAHHRCSLVIGRELAAPQLESCPVWPINCPAGLCHGSVAGFVFLLRVALKIKR